MTKYQYKTIIAKAKECTTSVQKEYKLGVTSKWSYYFAKAILNPKKNINKISFNNAEKPIGTPISRQIDKTSYTDMAKRLVKYVEQHKQLPNYITYGKYQIRTRLYTLMFAKVLVSYSKNGVLPKEVNVNYKAFTKPAETTNEVYEYLAKKSGQRFKSIDGFLNYIANHYKYEFYFDDKKSNKEVIDSKAGNCTDLLQMMVNVAEAMGYEWKVVHVQCRVSGTGHVRGKFRKKGSADWFDRDIACVADSGNITCIWCSDGYLLGTNPAWFVSNKNR